MKIFNTDKFAIQGYTDEDIYLVTAENICSKLISTTGTALRSIKIFTTDLQPSLLNQEDIKTSLLNFLRGNRHAQVQILVSDTTLAIQCGHKLIQLAQQLPSKVQIRITPEDYQHTGMSFISIDHSEFIYSAEQTFYSPCKYRSDKLSEFFSLAWEQAEQDPQTRRLSI